MSPATRPPSRRQLAPPTSSQDLPRPHYQLNGSQLLFTKSLNAPDATNRPPTTASPAGKPNLGPPRLTFSWPSANSPCTSPTSTAGPHASASGPGPPP